MNYELILNFVLVNRNIRSGLIIKKDSYEKDIFVTSSVICSIILAVYCCAGQKLCGRRARHCLLGGSQITSNNTENGFPPSNLLRPESDGMGTNQYIWHSSWNNPGPLPTGTDTYLQVHLNEAKQN